MAADRTPLAEELKGKGWCPSSPFFWALPEKVRVCTAAALLVHALFDKGDGSY